MPNDWQSLMQREREEFATISLDGYGVYCIAKQIDCTNQDATVYRNCLHINAVELALTDDDKIKAWIELGSSTLSLNGQAINSLSANPRSTKESFILDL